MKKIQDRNPVQGHTRSAGKSHSHARWRDEHSEQQGPINKQQAQTWDTNVWGPGLCGVGSNFYSPHFMTLHIFTPLETWKKNTNNISLSLFSSTPNKEWAKTKQDRGKDPEWRDSSNSTQYGRRNQTHREKRSFSGIPLPTTTSCWNQEPSQSSPLAGPALLLCFPGEAHKRLVGTRCLGFAVQSRRKQNVTLLACLRMWLQSWFFNCCGWESIVSWGKGVGMGSGCSGAVTLGSYHGAARGAVILEKLLRPRAGPGFSACGFAAAEVEAWARVLPKERDLHMSKLSHIQFSSCLAKGQAVGGFWYIFYHWCILEIGHYAVCFYWGTERLPE